MRVHDIDYYNKEMLLINYDSYWLSNTGKVKFYYALKGRGGKSGVIKYYNIEFLGKGVLLVPRTHKKDIISFFETWKIPYKITEIVMGKAKEVLRDE